MRRLSLLLAVLGLALMSRASADPFDNLSNRIDQYDKQTRGKVTRAQATSAPRAAQRNPTPAMPEDVQPVPMQGQGSYDGQYFDGGGGDYYPGDGWDDYGGANCSGEVCGGWGPARQYGNCYRGGWWGRAEYLAFWVRGMELPPLVTSSDQGTSEGDAGVLPATVLFGDGVVNTVGRSGGRFTLGYWFDACETLGLENTFFFVGGANDGFNQFSGGDPILARPFFNTELAEQDSVLVAFPDVVAGTIDVTTSRAIVSYELNVRRSFFNDCCRRLDFLVGYRYFRMAEGLNIENSIVTLGDDPSTTFAIEDSFNTTNNFNGANLGINWQITRGCWTIDLLGKVALGGVSQQAKIDGSTVITQDGDSQTGTGGVLALPSNIGNHKQSVFAALPEFNVNLRYQWTPLWKVSVGYTFMALTNVLRPGDQIDFNVDPGQFPPGQPGQFPAFAFNESDVWLQGINVGLECNF